MPKSINDFRERGLILELNENERQLLIEALRSYLFNEPPDDHTRNMREILKRLQNLSEQRG